MDYILNSIPIKWLSHTQAKILSGKYYLFKHNTFLGKILLNILMYIDIYLYNKNRLEFGEKRRKLLGNTFCALGRVISVGYINTCNLIEHPSKRGGNIGRVKFDKSLFPAHFPLFESNIGVNGEPHSIYHNILVKYLIGGGVSNRLDDTVSNNIVNTFISNIKTTKPRSKLGKNSVKINGSCSVDFDIDSAELFMIELLFYLFLNIKLNSNELKEVYNLISIGNVSNKYLLSRITNTIDNELENKIIDKIETSSILKKYSETNVLNKRQMAELLLAVIAIAGFLGLLNTLLASLSIDIHGKGNEFSKLPLDNDKLDNYILEVIRRFAPVNLVNIILEKPANILIDNCEYRFDEGTILAYSLLNSGFDSHSPFDNPYQFNSNRKGLPDTLIHFNSNGLGTEDNLLNNRKCPGRFIGIRIIKKILIELKKD